MKDDKSKGYHYRMGDGEPLDESTVRGPVSFVKDGVRYSTTGRATLCASTYLYAVKRGWEPEVL